MTEAPPIAFKRRSSSDTTLDVFGVDVTFLVENEHTGGRFGVLEYVSKPGHEPPPHWHEHEDEVFYIVEGQFEVHCGDQVFQVDAGGCIFLPKRKPHGFIIRSPHLRAVCVIQPSGAEQAFRGPWTAEKRKRAATRWVHLRFGYEGSRQSTQGSRAVWCS
jgi:mannose-6-phosphate isomerase-like protein (cupin superfamily)